MSDSDPAKTPEKALADLGVLFQTLGAQMKALNDNVSRLLEAQGVKPVPIPAPTPAPVTPPVVTPAPSTPVLDRPGVGLGVLGAVLTAALQVFGVVGPMTGEAATTTGQVLPILSAGTAALGATGTWGTALNALMTVGSMIFGAKQAK